MKNQLKILAISDFGTSGIAESLGTPLRHWHDEGHEIHHLTLGYTGWAAGIDKKRWPWVDRLMPVHGSLSLEERFGQRCIHQALEVSKADIVISAFDVWMVAYLAVPDQIPYLIPEVRQAISHRTRKFRHIAYFPLDGGTKGDHLGFGLDELIAGFDVPVTYSRYSQQMVYRDTHLQVPFIPIGHDSTIYKPGDKAESRKEMGLPDDKFIIGMVATNQYRKLWGEFVEGCAPFLKNHPDAMIIPWTTWDQKLIGGAEIADLLYRFDVSGQTLNPGLNVGKFTDEQMANMYRSLDVCALLTIGEGAGLPPLRARACGVPTLVSDNTSNSEFMVDEFEKIPNGARLYDPMGSNFERYLSDVPTFTAKLEELYANKSLRTRLQMKGPVGMAQYANDRLVPLWDDLLEEAMS